jgi:hypothetical protein
VPVPKPKGKAKGKAAAAQPPASAPLAAIASGEANVDAAVQLEKETTLERAAALQKRLANKIGDAKKTLLSLNGLQVGGPVLTMMSESANGLEKQFNAIAKFVQRGVNDDAGFEPYNKAAEALLAYYESKQQYAKALMSVQKRQQAATVAAQQVMADPASAGRA